jgi:hypothetical protein
MFRKTVVFFFLFAGAINSGAQVSHFVHARAGMGFGKQYYLGGYSAGLHKIMFHFSGGTASGFDNRYLAPDQIENIKSRQNVNESQTVFPDDQPADTYLERCNSTYTVQQLRLGFSLFFRNNDTLGRHPFSGPHVGVDATFGRLRETQTVTYKSKSGEERYSFSGINNFYEVGASTHAGWQFVFLKERLYLDLRAVISFYYPFMQEPNTKGPFAGNRVEGEVCIAWRFYKKADKDENVEGKVRGGI